LSLAWVGDVASRLRPPGFTTGWCVAPSPRFLDLPALIATQRYRLRALGCGQKLLNKQKVARRYTRSSVMEWTHCSHGSEERKTFRTAFQLVGFRMVIVCDFAHPASLSMLPKPPRSAPQRPNTRHKRTDRSRSGNIPKAPARGAVVAQGHRLRGAYHSSFCWRSDGNRSVGNRRLNSATSASASCRRSSRRSASMRSTQRAGGSFSSSAIKALARADILGWAGVGCIPSRDNAFASGGGTGFAAGAGAGFA
jgi:hypothetical protein